MDLINVLVSHKLWKQGVIVKVDSQNLFVKFNNKPLDKDTDTIKFSYPSAFANGFLKIVDNDELQQAILNYAAEKEETIKKEAAQRIVIAPVTHSAKKIAKKSYKRENIAFKCNYCDGGASANQEGFAGVCSKSIIEYNIKEAKRTWCSSAQCECFKYLNGELTYLDLCKIYDANEFLCYESGMLTNWKASAGTDVKNGKTDRPRKLKKIQRNSLCVLTTVRPNLPETGRMIFGVFLVDDSYEGDEQAEGYVSTASKYKLKLTPDEAEKTLFWNYYKNQKDEGKAAWASGLYRYINDILAAQILRDIAAVKKDKWDSDLAKEFFEHYCEVNNIDIDMLPQNNGALLNA
jgi:hypothetical protein